MKLKFSLVWLTKFCLLLICLCCFSCSSPKANDTLSIAVASNMQFAIKKIVKKFTDQTKIECDLIISSSGKLTAQIIEGAPYDILLSADLKYPMALYDKQLTTQAPKVYATGSLVLWTARQDLSLTLEVLESPHVKHIAVANPKTAPYGTAALEVLNSNGIYAATKDKLVYGESISQANRFVISGSAEIGFTSKSVVLSAELKDVVNWVEIPPSSYEPIEQGVALIKRSFGPNPDAEKFYNFLFSPTAKTVLKDFGYSVSE